MTYDDHTLAFMEKVAEDEEPKKHTALQTLSKVKALVKSRNPAKVLVKSTLAPIIEKVFEKEGHVSPLKIYEILSSKYGREWFDWEPETLWKTVSDDFSQEPHEDIKNTIQALQLLVNTNFAHEQWHIFEKVGHALNQGVVDFSTLQPLELDQIAYTLKCIQTIRPQQKFEPDVCGYIAACARTAGVVYLPDDLFGGGCQSFLDAMNNDIDLRNSVSAAWPGELKQEHSTSLKIQLLRLKEVQDYLSKVAA